MTDQAQDGTKVVAIPPLIYLTLLALGFGLDFLFRLPVLPNGLQYVPGGSVCPPVNCAPTI